MSITNKNRNISIFYNFDYLFLLIEAKDDEVSYSDLDFEEFDAPEMKKVKGIFFLYFSMNLLTFPPLEIEFTPMDMEKLRGDLGALLTAL